MANDQVIKNLDVKQLASLTQSPGDCDIIRRRLAGATWVVVGNDDTGCIALERGAKDFAQPDLG